MMIGLISKEESKSPKKTLKILIPRWLKTLFFLITMLISLIIFSLPLVLIIIDAFLPSALLSISLSPSSLNLQTLSSHFNEYDFRYSLIDIPLISIIRSVIILCVYNFCDGPKLSHGVYLVVATACSISSLVYVSIKASYVFMTMTMTSGYIRATEVALLVCSLVLAVGHVVVAYRTSCRERRKLLVYKIDMEAVSACNKGFPRYQKILQQARTM